MGHPFGTGASLRGILDFRQDASVLVRAPSQELRQPPPQIAPFFGISPTLRRVSFPAPAAAASLYSSAILAASLKIFTNIWRVSFPVWVF
jgi:hypothetical protein